MMGVRSIWLACAALGLAPAALAKAPAPAFPSAPKPVGRAGEWITDDDYPAVAVRNHMIGTTRFLAMVDATGKPTHCEIVDSSGFDVLDAATCHAIMERARFSPARDPHGQAVAGDYSNRIRWQIPQMGPVVVSEHFESMLLVIDKSNKITSCRARVHVHPTEAPESERPCGYGAQPPPSAAMAVLRGSDPRDTIDVEFQAGDAFTPALRTRMVSPVPGYTQSVLNVYHYTVNRSGKVEKCDYEEQRGNEHFAYDYCLESYAQTFDPPFSAFDKNGLAEGWHVARYLVKTGG
ncbi:TonB-like protein [Novosphingobium nitrogenifigens DSM 19370]|uniref:TonB-like protein n=1 Tax=Novosphingobium nitrogenifigens DSM 19370 TaxID=983920 RepID=F1Z3Z9_9SPHN|nr:TonB-like protein [Novosphingobium nitrogenifigens DSM 19370]